MLNQDNICYNVYFDFQKKSILMRINSSLNHLYHNLVKTVVQPFLDCIGNELKLEYSKSLYHVNILDSLKRSSIEEMLSYYDLGVVYVELNVYTPFIEVFGKRFYFEDYFEILPDTIKDEFENFKRKLIQYWWEIRRVRLMCSPEIFKFGRYFSLCEFELLKLNVGYDDKENKTRMV